MKFTSSLFPQPHMNKFNWTITARSGLDTQTLGQAEALAAEVLRVDGISLKIDWEYAAELISGQAASFCCFAGTILAGYALLEETGASLEVTAAVAPAFRRQGIFKALLDASAAEARRRGATELLGVGYRNSAAGTAAAAALGLPSVFSEYRMEASADAMPMLPTGQMTLETVTAADAAALAQMITATFGREKFSAETLAARLGQPNVRYWFAVLDGRRIGQIGTVETGAEVYVRGVGILPGFRRQGHGRGLLMALMARLLNEGQTKFALDVETENPAALQIYETCGFQAKVIYDYYTVYLSESA